MKKNIAILGTGISGLSIANLLNKENNVKLFEIKAEIGGLIKCDRVNDCLYHKVGGHVFNSKSEKVLDWFWSFFDKDRDFVKATRKAKILYDEKIIGYPIENYLYLLPSDLIKRIVCDLLNNRIKDTTVVTFKEFLVKNFGKTLYEIYFEPYNLKIWNYDLDKIPLEWLDGKLPMPNITEIFMSNILREEEGNMVHSSFYYPKYGGSQFIVDNLSKNLHIETSFDPNTICIKSGKIEIAGVVYDKLVYTGNIKELPQSMQELINPTLYSKVTNLVSNGTSNMFCETDVSDISWLYIPQDYTKVHRIIYTGNFSDSNNQGSNRKTCVVEFSGKVSEREMYEEIKKLPGNLTPISHNYEKNSYVIQNQDTRQIIQEVKNVLEKENIFLLGRFAEWEYYNMDKAIEAAMSLAENIN